MDRSPEVISRLILERGPWDYVDDTFAARIPFDSPHESRDLLARMVREGTSTAHRLVVDGRRCGLLVTRCEDGNQGRELVCQAVFLDHPADDPLTKPFADACEALARAEGCNVLRFHTCRPAMARFACENYGYRVSEIVLRRTLPPLPPHSPAP